MNEMELSRSSYNKNRRVAPRLLFYTSRSPIIARLIWNQYCTNKDLQNILETGLFIELEPY